MDFGALVYAKGIVYINIKIITCVGLPKDEIKHFQETFNVLIGTSFIVVEVREIIYDF